MDQEKGFTTDDLLDTRATELPKEGLCTLIVGDRGLCPVLMRRHHTLGVPFELLYVAGLGSWIANHDQDSG